MKRLITCAALLLVAAVVAFAVHRKSPVLLAEDGAIVIVDPATGFDGLRQRLLERFKSKVELMSDEEVQQALATTDAEIRVMKAKQQLDRTAESLRALADQFEGTPSAELALEMLSVHDRGGMYYDPSSPTLRTPIFETPAPSRSPQPDSDFNPRTPTPDRRSAPISPTPADDLPGA